MSNSKNKTLRWKTRNYVQLFFVVFVTVWLLVLLKVFVLNGATTTNSGRRRQEPAALYIPTAAQEQEDVINMTNFSSPAHALQWPPVLLNGTVPEGDGADVMSLLGIKVPRFYQPPPATDPNNVGFQIDGQDTIFLMIASYRDFQVDSRGHGNLQPADVSHLDTPLTTSAAKPSPPPTPVPIIRSGCLRAWSTKQPPGTLAAWICRYDLGHNHSPARTSLLR